MAASRCNGICDRHRDEWRPPRNKRTDTSETGRYTNAMLCRACYVWVRTIFAVGKANNRCPCCNNLMRTHRHNARIRKAKALGYDPRDRTRI